MEGFFHLSRKYDAPMPEIAGAPRLGSRSAVRPFRPSGASGEHENSFGCRKRHGASIIPASSSMALPARGDRLARRGALLNKRFEPLPVGLQVGIFHLDRAGVVGQHVEEHSPKDARDLLALRGVHQVHALDRVTLQVVELLGPQAVSDVMPAPRPPRTSGRPRRRRLRSA